MNNLATIQLFLGLESIGGKHVFVNIMTVLACLNIASTRVLTDGKRKVILIDGKRIPLTEAELLEQAARQFKLDLEIQSLPGGNIAVLIWENPLRQSYDYPVPLKLSFAN